MRNVTFPWPAFGAVALVFALLGFAAGSGTSSRPPTRTVTATAAAPSTSTAPADPTIPGDGTFVVGTQVQPGTYVSTGTGSCYWARLSDASGTLDGVIANDSTTGQAVVTIEATDVAFKTQGCGGWVGQKP